ncbi:MAG: ammonium transporter [Armatimonadota bacterium]
MKGINRFAKPLVRLLFAILVLILSATGFAFAEGGEIDTGDTAWLLASAAMVLLMTPGLALFYAGMVRRKNALGTIMQSLVMCGIGAVTWVLWGYSLAFGTDHFGLIGSLEHLGLKGVGLEAADGLAIPSLLFAMFQGMFAIITPALISGAVTERISFKAYIAFVILWQTFVYAPVAHWVWHGDGWLFKLGALDFAGGTVVHIISGVSSLCAVLVIGARKRYGTEEFKPHNLTMTILGTGLLWFGWFGFNAGSALGASDIAVNAFAVTNTCAAAGGLAWMIIEWIHRGKPTALGFASGAVAGLVAITPACGFVGIPAALIMGVFVSLICYSAIMAKGKLGYDDSLDVFGLHGVGGMFGALATGLFASTLVNDAGANGLFYGGGATLLGKQVIAIAAVLVFAFVLTFIMIKLIGIFTPLRVSEADEDTGYDIAVHGEVGYNL